MTVSFALSSGTGTGTGAGAGAGTGTDAEAVAKRFRDVQSKRLLHVSEVPLWMRDNDYLRTGYRPPQPTIWSCLKTGLFTLSNDSINIYTHLIGFLILIPVTCYFLIYATSPSAFTSRSPPCTTTTITPISETMLQLQGLSRMCDHPDTRQTNYEKLLSILSKHKWGLTPLLTSGMVCLFASATFHTFWVLSPRAMNHLAKFDFIGIACLCVGHGKTGLFYMFYCDLERAKPFQILMSIAFLLTIPAILSPTFATPKARPIRGLLFGGLGSLALIPLFKAVTNIENYVDYVTVVSELVSIFIYGSAGCIYVSRFPECCRIGKHDRFFASHQVMHFLVLLGITTHLVGCHYVLQTRMQYGCSIPTSL